ncbi:MAG: NUDIX domain-containing protein [Candidatus Methylomirabilota bacterium]
MILKIIDPENASRVRALETEIALIDAQLANRSVSAAEYIDFQFKKESLARELRERNYQEKLRTLKASHPFKVVKLTRGQVNQGDVAVHGVELDAGQISFRLPIESADFNDAELQINGETVRALRYDLSDFDPLSRQFLLTIDFVSPSGAGHDPQIAYMLKLDRRHEQGSNDPRLGKNKPFRVMVPYREPAPVTVPVASGIPGGVFHALVPEGTIVSAGTSVGFIDASGYQQEQLDAAKGLRKLVGEISAANQNFAAVSPEELRRLNAEAGLRIASLKGVNPKIVIRAPVAGRVEGLIPVEGQTVIPGKTTGIRILNSLVFLGSTDLSDSNHLIDVPKGSVREGERVRVRTPLGNVLDGTVFKVQPLADENGLWLSDRDALVAQVEDPAGQLGDDMPVEIWTGVSASEKEKTPAPAAGLAALPLHYGSDLPPAVLYQLLRHPDQNLSGSVRSVLAGEGSFRQILSSWKFFFGSPKGLASFGDMLRTGLFLVIGTIVSLWSGTKIVRSLRQKLKWLDPQSRLNDLAFETRELQIRLEQKGQTQDKELLEDVITSVNEWIRILSDDKDFDHENLSTILIKAQELAGNKHLAFSKMKFQDLGMWKDGIGDDLAAIYGILTVLSILTARRIAAQSQKGSSMELHEFHQFQQGIVDYGDIFNESYALAHHLIGLSQTMDLYPPKVVLGLKPLSVFDGLKIFHNQLVRFLYPMVRMWLWVSPVVFLHKIDTLRSYHSLSKKMEKLGLKTPEDTPRDVKNAKQGLNYALNSQVTVNQPAGSKMAMHYGRFWRRFVTILAISSLFLPTIVLTYLGLHWFTATALMSIGKIILPFAAIGFHIIPILTNFSGRHHNAWDHELSRLWRQNVRRERFLPELPKPQSIPKNSMAVAMPRQGSERIAMSKVLNALHEGAQDTDLEVVALVPPQYGENKTVLEQFIQSDVVLRRWAITVAESDGEFPGDAGLFYAARNIAKTSQKKFKIYWYPQAGIDFQKALSVFKINLGEAARMIGDLRSAGVRFGEVAFPGGNLISSSVGITKNGGHFVVQARHASLNEIENERLPAILGRNGTSRLEIEHVFYDPQKLRQMLAAGPLHLGSGRVDLGNTALPQIPVPTGPIAIVAETPEDHQTIQELLDKTDDKVRNLIGRFGPFRINFLEDIVRPVAELSRQVAKSSATPPNPNLLVNRTVRLSDDSIVSPYDKLYTAVSRFLWNGGNGNRRNLKAEAFIPPVSETVYVSGEDRQKLSQVLRRVSDNFPELVDLELSQKLWKDGPAEAKAKLVFRDDAGRPVLEKKKPGYRRGLRSVDVAGFVTKDRKLLLQRRNHQVGNEPGRLDVSFAGHQDETDNDAEAAAQREFHEELLGGRNSIPSGLTFHVVGPEVQLDITHEGEKGLSIRKKSTVVFRVSLNNKPSWDDFLPGDNAVEIVGLTREELETALEETPGRFTARAFQLFTKLGPELVFLEPGTGLAGRPEQRSAVNQPPASRSELRNEIPLSVIPLPVAGKDDPLRVAVRFKEKEVEIPQFQVRTEIRILAAIIVAEKILAVNDAGLMPRLEASLEDRGMVSGRVAPAFAVLAGAHDVPVEVLKTRLESLFRQERIQTSADDRIVFLDAGTVPAGYLKKLMNSPVPVVVLFDRRHQALHDQVSKEQLHRNQESCVLLVYAPDGVSTFVKRALQSGDAFLTASPRLNAVLTHFRNHGKADDIALITSGRAESQKVEADYVGHRYYYGDETLRLDPELIFYSLQLLLRSPELFRYGKGRNAQDAVSLIGLVLQQLAQEFQAKRGITSAV